MRSRTRHKECIFILIAHFAIFRNAEKHIIHHIKRNLHRHSIVARRVYARSKVAADDRLAKRFLRNLSAR